MPRPVRISLIVVGGLVAAGLGAAPAQAAPGDPVPLFEPGPSADPADLRPLTQTAAGTVYEKTGSYDLWIQPTGGTPVTEDRFQMPLVAGDLIQDSNAGPGDTLTWRTIADPTLHEHVVPEDLHIRLVTERGYIANRGQGPYDLVSVDLRDGGEETVIGTATEPPANLAAGPAGLLTYGYDGGNLRYYPFATPGTGRVLTSTTNQFRECPVVTASSAYCIRDVGLARYPLAGGAPTTVTMSGWILDIAPTSSGVAVLHGNGLDRALSTWAGTTASPVVRLPATWGAGGSRVVPTPARTSVLVTRDGPLGQAGLWNIPLPGGSSTLVVTAPPSDRSATRVAIGPGAVAWTDNAQPDGSVWSRDLSAGAPAGPERLVSGPPDSLSDVAVGAGRVAYRPAADAEHGPGVLMVWDGSTTDVVDYNNAGASFSGDRLLLRSWGSGPDGEWSIRDLRTGATTYLDPAVDYDLWGERLVRLDDDGQVTVKDLRTGDTVVLRPATPAPYVGGTVHVAGDTVAWDIASGESNWGVALTNERKVRDLGTMAAATDLPMADDRWSSVIDLSPGYALTQGCIGEACGLWAMPVDGGAAKHIGSLAAQGNAAIDGNTVAFLDGDGYGAAVPSVVTLPGDEGAPRLLVAPESSTTAGAGRAWALRVVTSRLLTECSVEIRDASDALVRTLECTDAHASALAGWDATDEDGDTVPPGDYTWALSGATGADPLVDYDGSTAALSGTVTVSDDPAPTLTGRAPAADGTSALPSGNVTATFSEPVTGVSGTTFRLSDKWSGVAVPAAVTYDAATRTATLNPSASLRTDTLYTATITGGASAIRDGGGNPLTTTSWTFSTGPAPVITKFAPAGNGTGATLSGNVTATFSEYVMGVDSGTFALAKAGGSPVAGTVDYERETGVATFDPSAALLPDTRYTATLTGGAEGIVDAAHNPFVTRSWSFTTGPAPTVTGISPAANATGVGRTANVVAAFSEAVTGVSSTTVKLKTSSGTAVSAVVSYSTTSRKLTINPSKTLSAKTKYTVTLTGGTTAIRDTAGNPMTTRTWSFTTGS